MHPWKVGSYGGKVKGAQDDLGYSHHLPTQSTPLSCMELRAGAGSAIQKFSGGELVSLSNSR
jgi:hypothetical protein